MAKTTKNTKRTVSTKKRGLFSKINFSSKKTQFIVVIAIVALMGGGWFTYRSFAYVFYNVSPQESTLWCNSSSCIPVKDAQKNGNEVLAMRNGASAKAKSVSSLVKGRKYNMCIFAKGNGNINLQISGYQFANFKVRSTGGYQSYCTSPTMFVGIKPGYVSFTHQAGTNEVRLARFYIEY